MPSAPPRPCVTCGRIGCADHTRKAWAKKPAIGATPRLSGWKTDQRRRALLGREPLCRICLKDGRVTVATIRDHIVPLAEGGEENTDGNEQALCRPCHQAKTALESKRGVRRPW